MSVSIPPWQVLELVWIPARLGLSWPLSLGGQGSAVNGEIACWSTEEQKETESICYFTELCVRVTSDKCRPVAPVQQAEMCRRLSFTVKEPSWGTKQRKAVLFLIRHSLSATIQHLSLVLYQILLFFYFWLFNSLTISVKGNSDKCNLLHFVF